MIVNKILFILFLVSSSFPCWSQFSITQEGKKQLLKYGTSEIYKTRKDSIIIGDSAIATIYKRRRAHYLNQQGDKIYSVKKVYASPFISGTAYIKNRKEKYAIINSKGDEICEFIYDQKPIRYGRLTAAYYFGGYRLYSTQSMIDRDIDTLQKHGDLWLETRGSKIVTKTTYVKKLFKTTKKNSKERLYFVRLYNMQKEEQEILNLKKITPYDNYLVCTDKSGLLHIRSMDDSYDVNTFDDFNYITPTRFMTIHEDERSLYNAENGDLLVSGAYDSIVVNKDAIQAFYGESELNVDIFDAEGVELYENLNYVKELSDNRHIFEKDSLQFIGSDRGEQLSMLYSEIGAQSEGIRLVYEKGTYQYIDDESYEPISRKFPIITSNPPSTGGRGSGGFLKAFLSMTGNLVRAFTFQKPHNYGLSYNGEKDSVFYLEKGRPYKNGFAIVAVSYLNDTHLYEKPIFHENNGLVYRNYLDKAGNFINNEKYIRLSPFKNGYAWVRSDRYYHLIDTSGQEVEMGPNMQKITSLKEIDLGYYSIQTKGKTALVSPHYQLISDCKYHRIKFNESDSTFVGIFFSEETILEKVNP